MQQHHQQGHYSSSTITQNSYRSGQMSKDQSHLIKRTSIETEVLKSCICSQVSRLKNQLGTTPELLQCRNQGCTNKLHFACMKISLKDEESIQQFECPSCILRKYDPLHQVVQTFIDSQVVSEKTFSFSIKEDIFKRLRDQNEYCLEMRCIRIDGSKNIYETTWPDCGSVKINDQTIFELKPLQNNSSLKKRKDEKFTFKNNKILKEGENILTIHEYSPDPSEKQSMRLSENSIHCFSIFLVQRLSAEALANNIKRDSIRPAEESRASISQYFNKKESSTGDKFAGSLGAPADDDDDDLCIDSLSVPLTCSLDMKLIQTPAKGRFCKHFQCFSLENFILTTETVNPRKWRCNICRAKCYDIVIDGYILSIIREVNEKNLQKVIADVKFDSKGAYSFGQIDPSDDDDDDDNSNSPPMKPNPPPTQKPAPLVRSQSASNQPAPSTVPAQQAIPSNNSFVKNSLSSIPQQQSIISKPIQLQQSHSNKSSSVSSATNKRKQDIVVIDLDSDEDNNNRNNISDNSKHQQTPVQLKKAQSTNLFSNPVVLQQQQSLPIASKAVKTQQQPLQQTQQQQYQQLQQPSRVGSTPTNYFYQPQIGQSSAVSPQNNEQILKLNPQIPTMVNQIPMFKEAQEKLQSFHHHNNHHHHHLQFGNTGSSAVSTPIKANVSYSDESVDQSRVEKIKGNILNTQPLPLIQQKSAPSSFNTNHAQPISSTSNLKIPAESPQSTSKLISSTNTPSSSSSGVINSKQSANLISIQDSPVPANKKDNVISLLSSQKKLQSAGKSRVININVRQPQFSNPINEDISNNHFSSMVAAATAATTMQTSAQLTDSINNASNDRRINNVQKQQSLQNQMNSLLENHPSEFVADQKRLLLTSQLLKVTGLSDQILTSNDLSLKRKIISEDLNLMKKRIFEKIVQSGNNAQDPICIEEDDD